MRIWYIKNSNLFQELKRLISSKYSSLHISTREGIVYIKGGLILNTPDGKEIDRYLIEIQIPDDYPRSTPIVRETGGRLPKIIDRHFYPNDKTACLFLRDERYKFYPKGSTIIDFIEGPVKNFFIWQMDYDLNGGNSSFGGRPHGANAIFQFYTEELGINNRSIIRNCLYYLSKENINGKWPCYCGSRKRLRGCHLNKLMDLRSKILYTDAKKTLNQILYS